MLLNKLKAIATAAMVVLAAAAVAYGVFAGGQPTVIREAAQRPAAKPTDLASGQKAPQGLTEDAKKPTRLVISLDKKSYEIGEPIALTVRLINSGSAPFDVLATSDTRGQYDTTFSFVVKNDEGKTLKHPGRSYFGAMSLLGGQQTVAPSI